MPYSPLLPLTNPTWVPLREKLKVRNKNNNLTAIVEPKKYKAWSSLTIDNTNPDIIF